MKTIIYLFTTFLLFSCSGNEVNKNDLENNSEVTKVNFIKTFEGKIDNKYEIIAKLESNDNKISGTYNYKNSSGEMELSGDFSNENEFEIKEFNSKGSMTGIFEGTFTNGKMEGTWSNAKGDKTLPFYLIESTTNYSSKPAIPNIGGDYKAYSNTLTISNVKESSFKAEFCLASDQCEMGCYSGEFQINSGGDYIGFLDLNPNKKVTIKINGVNLEISSELEAAMDFGAHCGLDGEYKK